MAPRRARRPPRARRSAPAPRPPRGPAAPALLLVVPHQGLGGERVLLRWPVAGPAGRPGYVFRHTFPGAAHGEVVHLFRAWRLLPIRRNASFMYFSIESCGGTSLSAFSAS